MRRSAIFLVIGLAMALIGLAPGAAGAAEFEQCPHVDHDTGCQFLITVTSSGVTIAEDASQSAYDQADDTLVGIQNNSSAPISSIPLSSSSTIFGFDKDGICEPPEGARAPGCVVLEKNAEGENPEVKPGTKCVETAYPEQNDVTEPCGFEPPSGEPSGLTTFGEFVEPVGFAKNGDAVSGYEGPGMWFTDINAERNSGIVNFSPALAPGKSAYLGLEEELAENGLTVGAPATLSTTLSGGGQSAGSITVVQGTPVTDTSTVSGSDASVAAGSVSYSVYSDAACTTLATSAGSATVSAGAGGPSTAISSLAPGTYYWQAHYSGELFNQAATSTCGSEVLTVLAATTTTTGQSGQKLTGPSITVTKGTPVTDRAQISGSLASTATGTVTYTLYSNSTCTAAVGSSSAADVSAGVAGSSAAVAPPLGTYYWRAVYSGAGLNAGSTSTCGGEVLVVARSKESGLPSAKQCLKRTKIKIQPRIPRIKLVSEEILVNGKLVSKGALTKRTSTVSLASVPSGTIVVTLITRTAGGQVYEQIRTFHTCAAKKKKHDKG